MRDGKKSTAEGILYGAFDLIEERSKEEPLKVFKQGARQRQAEARGEVPPRRRRDLPGPRRGPPGAPRRPRHALARHLLARRGEKTMDEKLAGEIVDAAKTAATR